MNQTNWPAFIAGQAGVVPLVIGSPGTGKTAVFRALAEALGRRFLPYYLDQALPEDLAGCPVPRTVRIGDTDYDCAVKLLDETLLRAKTEPSVVLIDELTNAGHSLQAAALQWINDPPKSCLMFAAANPVDQAAAGVDLCAPMVNRLCVIPWERPVEERRQGWRNGFKDYPAPSFPIVPEDFLETCGCLWGDLLCQFEDRFPELFGEQAFPKEAAAASMPYPSDRSWTNAGRLLAAADSVGADSEVRAKLVTGCVGEAAAQQFLRWLVSLELPDPEDLLAAPHTLKLPHRFDLSRAIITSVVGRVKANPTPARWEAGVDVVVKAFEQQEEVGMSAMGSLQKAKPHGYEPRKRHSGSAQKMSELEVAMFTGR